MSEGIEGVEQSLLQAYLLGKIGVDRLACGFVTKAEAEATDNGGQRGTEGGDEQEQVEESLTLSRRP